MIDHEVRAYPSSARLAREEQLAWKLAAVATDPVDVPGEVAEMVVNRVIDDAAVAAGIGALLGLDTVVVYQAIGQALHCTTQTRQSRKGEISSWKAYAPAFAGKVAVEAADRAMRGQGAPSPIYEGEDGVIAWLLG